MADFTLTTGSDTVTGTDTDDTVYADWGTLNSGDSLIGGAGTDSWQPSRVLKASHSRAVLPIFIWATNRL